MGKLHPYPPRPFTRQPTLTGGPKETLAHNAYKLYPFGHPAHPAVPHSPSRSRHKLSASSQIPLLPAGRRPPPAPPGRRRPPGRRPPLAPLGRRPPPGRRLLQVAAPSRSPPPLGRRLLQDATGSHGGADGLSTGRKLVPWSSWAEWRFVRDGFFSPFPAAALRRIAAWRSRGPLLIPVDVTAAFVEIRLRDPFFRSGMTEDDTLESEEMLAMLYSMAIMRLVNGFLENTNKKTGRSISEFAEAVGIPRVLVDIRHESSHRSLPSLRLLRLAAIKAFDWLKCIYWDSQTNAIPDAQVELRSRLHEIDQFLKGKDSKNAKSVYGHVLKTLKRSLKIVVQSRLSTLISKPVYGHVFDLFVELL